MESLPDFETLKKQAESQSKELSFDAPAEKNAESLREEIRALRSESIDTALDTDSAEETRDDFSSPETDNIEAKIASKQSKLRQNITSMEQNHNLN